MHHLKNLFFFAFLLPTIMLYGQQKVGVVLSGGGASGMAHVGVLKALEENNIPIDYITGTSIGALVGGLYAAGYSPEQIEKMVSDPSFLDAANGIIDQNYQAYFKKGESNSSMLSWKFNLDSTFEANIPTSFVNSTPIDFGLMVYLTNANTVSQGNFDNLFIPFRCIASNITDREQMVFREGNLPSSIRASMTYPFYLTPIELDGKLMFDGGLYNNFPADVICEEFNPDFIIASNVSSRIDDPTEDNLVSQVKSMLIKNRTLTIPCADGIIINSEVDDISTFDFNLNSLAIQRGYQSTLKKMQEIQSKVKTRVYAQQLSKARSEFREKQPLLRFDKLKFMNYPDNQAKYFIQKVNLKGKSFDVDRLLKPYFALASEEKIRSIYPIATYDSSSQFYNLTLDVKEDKNFTASFGGIVSSKPFSTGFFEIDYKTLKSTSLNLNANIYFGRFYSSVQGKVRWDIPFDVPFYLESKFTINQYDFFNNQATFIDIIEAPYIITNEQYADLNIGLPALNKAKVNFGANYYWQEFNYYQSENFNRGDTADISMFEGYSTYAKYERNTLNKKMYASKGDRLQFMLRQINGREKTIPGSTAITKKEFSKSHHWTMVKLEGEKYFLEKQKIRVGGLLEMVFSDQSPFQNYTATLLNAPVFQPLPETKTIFMEQYRAFTYLGAGLNLIYAVKDNIDLRASAFLFQPYEELKLDNSGLTKFGEEVSERDYLGTFTLVYHSRFGPLAANLNYYHDNDEPFSFLVHFGYLIFNQRARD